MDNGDAGDDLGTVRPLPSSITVLDGTDVDALWEPFRFFEAGHHAMVIMNPLDPGDLADLVDLVDPRPGERLLDIACGHGELLRLVTERTETAGTGVDLSPWTLRRAADRLTEALPAELRPRLILGDGRAALEGVGTGWDIVALVGAPWVFGGFAAAAATLARHLGPGGRLVIADIVLHDAAAVDELPPSYGRPLTEEEQRTALTDAGLTIVAHRPSPPDRWRAYNDRALDGLRAWAERFPDERHHLERGLAEDAERVSDDLVGWGVWVCRVERPT